MPLYQTCQVIMGFSEKGDFILCGKKTLDGSAYCPEHAKDGTAILPWDEEEFADDEFTPAESGRGGKG
jgi:hypothetical protein